MVLLCDHVYTNAYNTQGQCGASYAFSAVGTLEGAWALAHGRLTPLSEQNIIDCSGIYTVHELTCTCIVFS